jgi:ribonuclease HII
LHATFLAMRRAVLSMSCRPDLLLVDGNRLPRLSGLGGEISARAIIGGDATERAISAASILAKTARDHYMNQMHALYPEYAFASHKGYATALHRHLLAKHGPCPLHRRSFAPVGAFFGAADDLNASEVTQEFDFDPELESAQQPRALESSAVEPVGAVT